MEGEKKGSWLPNFITKASSSSNTQEDKEMVLASFFIHHPFALKPFIDFHNRVMKVTTAVRIENLESKLAQRYQKWGKDLLDCIQLKIKIRTTETNKVPKTVPYSDVQDKMKTITDEMKDFDFFNSPSPRNVVKGFDERVKSSMDTISTHLQNAKESIQQIADALQGIGPKKPPVGAHEDTQKIQKELDNVTHALQKLLHHGQSPPEERWPIDAREFCNGALWGWRPFIDYSKDPPLWFVELESSREPSMLNSVSVTGTCLFVCFDKDFECPTQELLNELPAMANTWLRKFKNTIRLGIPVAQFLAAHRGRNNCKGWFEVYGVKEKPDLK
jgi:hypothetical protein